jgi:hypothetical protein
MEHRRRLLLIDPRRVEAADWRVPMIIGADRSLVTANVSTVADAPFRDRGQRQQDA